MVVILEVYEDKIKKDRKGRNDCLGSLLDEEDQEDRRREEREKYNKKDRKDDNDDSNLDSSPEKERHHKKKEKKFRPDSVIDKFEKEIRVPGVKFPDEVVDDREGMVVPFYYEDMRCLLSLISEITDESEREREREDDDDYVKIEKKIEKISRKPIVYVEEKMREVEEEIDNSPLTISYKMKFINI